MKDLTLLIWLTQLGLSVVSPLVSCILIAVWLHSKGVGTWVIWLCALIGTVMAIDGLRNSLKLMSRSAKDRKDPSPPPVAFNDHI